MIQQLAVNHGIYVVHVNVRTDSSGFPGRSEIADRIPTTSRDKKLEKYWKLFITAGLVEVEACKMVGITPVGFYYLQTKDIYRSYRKDFAARVQSLFKSYSSVKLGSCDQKLKDHVKGLPVNLQCVSLRGYRTFKARQYGARKYTSIFLLQ